MIEIRYTISRQVRTDARRWWSSYAAPYQDGSVGWSGGPGGGVTVPAGRPGLPVQIGARQKSEIFIRSYLNNQSPDRDPACNIMLTAPRSLYSNGIRPRTSAVSSFVFRPAYLMKQRSKRGVKYRKMTAVSSSIEWDPFQPDSWNRPRAVGLQIPRICRRRPRPGRQGSAGRPGKDQEQSTLMRFRPQHHCCHRHLRSIVPGGTELRPVGLAID